MLGEFRDFIMKGSVLDLAVAVIIAAAFGAVITSFTNDILMPPIGMALGDMDFTELRYVIAPAEMDGAGAIVKEEVAIRWGMWVKTLIDFLIIGFVLFMIIRTYNKSQQPAEEAPAGPSSEDLLGEIRDLLKNQ